MGGKAGDMLPAFKDGFTGTAANRGVMTDEDLEAAKKYKDLTKEASSFWEDIKTNVGISALELATKGIKLLTGGTESDNPNQSLLEARLAEAKRVKAMRQAGVTEASNIQNRFTQGSGPEAPSFRDQRAGTDWAEVSARAIAMANNPLITALQLNTAALRAKTQKDNTKVPRPDFLTGQQMNGYNDTEYGFSQGNPEIY
jgi:hypothetical protein